MSGWADAAAAATTGDVGKAFTLAMQLLQEGEGSPAEKDEENFRAFNRSLTIWEQIDLYATAADRWPRRGRLWKLLGYSYMRGGVYIPALLKAAEQAFLIFAAHAADGAQTENAGEKIDLCRQAAAGNEEARAEIAAAEALFAREAAALPERIAFPSLFVQMGIAARSELIITPDVLAPDLRRVLEDGDTEWTES